MKRESTCLIGFLVLGRTTCQTTCHVELEYNNNEYWQYLEVVSVVFDSYNYSKGTGCVSYNKADAQLLINCSHLGKG